MALAVQLQSIEFEEKLNGLIRQFEVYENGKNREIALKHLTQFTTQPNDTTILKLLAWFKESFFSWMDSPSCPGCSKITQPLGQVAPTPEEIKDSAGRVESYTCSTCWKKERNRVVARFPRYNNPIKLLETRTGRCGEWANCFALLCRALGYEVRYVCDWTDHVWVEIFLYSQNRWIHCDPCENSFDNPLLYETGWGKKLTYVIAVSHDDIQDVTWKYSHSQNHKEVLSRRLLVPEVWLVSTIIKLRKRMQSKIIPARRQILQSRLIKELVEFMSPTKTVSESEMKGRISGALDWRQARHETGKDNRIEGFEWDVNSSANANSTNDGVKIFELKYDCVQDKYFFDHEDQPITKPGWQNGLFRSSNMHRKEERDWKMVYLAREANTARGSLSWKFVNESENLEIKSVHILLHSTTFHQTGVVSIEIATSSGKHFIIPKCFCEDGKWNWKSGIDDGVTSSSWMIITCYVEGGDGNLAWQHAQLFRQSTSACSPESYSPPLSIKITTQKIQENN